MDVMMNTMMVDRHGMAEVLAAVEVWEAVRNLLRQRNVIFSLPAEAEPFLESKTFLFPLPGAEEWVFPLFKPSANSQVGEESLATVG
ncbi:hypothetical protein Tco_1273009 [Tanacetum coccineum]